MADISYLIKAEDAKIVGDMKLRRSDIHYTPRPLCPQQRVHQAVINRKELLNSPKE
jgi:hypothetical protein